MSDGQHSWDLPRLQRDLSDTQFRHLQAFATVASTNTLALEAAARGEEAGQVFFADEQTAGRGRGGHTWHSTPGDGLYVSALVRPRLAAAQALWISLAAGLAVWRAVGEVTGLHADIRWPNDLLLGPKKFCGILTETALEGDLLRHAVIGIGVNVNHGAFPAELDGIATSLRLASGVPQPRHALLTALLRALDAELRALESGEAPANALRSRLRNASTWMEGRRVHVPEQGGYTGVTAGLDARGFLQVQTAVGMRTVLSGGVRAAAE